MTDSNPSLRRIIGEALRSSRRIVADGEVYVVYELPPLPFDRRSTPSLVFESEHVMRRVRNFPPEWRSLSDDDLFAVSRNT